MSDNRNAEQAAGETATDGFAIWCHQEALRTWREPRHQQALYARLIEDRNLRNAFAAGSASRREEVDHFRDEMVNFYKETVVLRDALRRLLADTEGMVKSWETFNGFDRLKASWEAGLAALSPEDLREGDSNVAMGEFQS